MVTVHLFGLMGSAAHASYSSFWGYPKSMGQVNELKFGPIGCTGKLRKGDLDFRCDIWI